MSRPALLAVSHGTSDPDGAAAIAALVAAVAERLPDVDVRAAFVDVQQPDAVTAVAASTGPTVVVPLLLSQGFHVRVDLGQAAAGRDEVVVTAPLGPDVRLARVLAARIAELEQTGVVQEPDVPIVLAVAGSRDPRSVSDAEQQSALLAEVTGREVITAYLAARTPTLPDVLRQHPHADVATYLLARGFFFDLAGRQAGDHAITAPLLDGAAAIDSGTGSGPDSEPPTELVDLVVARYSECTLHRGSGLSDRI
ncbi:CbiX/SirB N-terminal domain-containing protein [Microbacterium sp. H1-D42]|uniref:sirohydrochlorin chelatase n=1 Tax=Microbacterium sp. H1-D42 TaxID=2925844 RepID=UPI001F531F4D|nr:CbiX/SirB N-terminal domain-containing protein [Microbacterium sp. H1-D42]UNK71065.1 cobalamin biosynthesis protein CbiX [Microbacterium sp. H1-D42]